MTKKEGRISPTKRSVHSRTLDAKSEAIHLPLNQTNLMQMMLFELIPLAKSQSVLACQ
jgi:hypothetical protein